MLRRADVSNDGGSGMDTNSQSADTLHTIRISQLNAFQNAQGTKATLKYHLRAVKDGHDTISAELIHVAAVIMNDVHLLGQKRTDKSEQMVRLHELRKGRETAYIRETNCNITLLGGRQVSGDRGGLHNLQGSL